MFLFATVSVLIICVYISVTKIANLSVLFLVVALRLFFLLVLRVQQQKYKIIDFF